MAEDEAPLSPEQLKVVVRKAEQYVALWMAAGLAVFVWRLASGWFDGIYVFDVVPGYVAGWAAMVATVPVLGAALAVLGLETTHANHTIDALLQAAKSRSLTRPMYHDARKAVEERAKSWAWSLGALAVVAFYNTAGLTILLHFPKMNPNLNDHLLEEDFVYVVYSKFQPYTQPPEDC